MKWEDDEIVFMTAALEQGWTHKEIGNELNRSEQATRTKASKLNLLSSNNQKKTTDEYKKQLPDDIILLEPYITTHIKILHKHLSCGYIWGAQPSHILNGKSCPKCAGNIKKSTEDYKKQLPDDIILLGKYINAHTKIKHKHSCGFEWKSKPNNILRGRGCPRCNNSFNNYMPGATYLIYFPEHDLYKFGISNNYLTRFKSFGSKPEVVFIREFDLGSEARELEQQWSKNVDHLKINTGVLTSGNTETFVY